MFRAQDQGIYKEVSLPLFGRQDVGITPGGAMDLFAFETGNALLGNHSRASALELIFPPSFHIEEEGFIILTGARFDGVNIRKQGKSIDVPHGTVVRVRKGDSLDFGYTRYGFRGYLCYRKLRPGEGKGPEGRKRPSFDKISSWRDSQGFIRVVRGPEYGFLENPELFIREGWTITTDLSDMGMRITCGGNKLRLNMTGNMISEAVSDGTVQLSPGGPIILLRHRQTVGGYPRIFNVITADIDMLAQYGAGQVLHFKEVSLKTARKAIRLRNREIEKLRKRK
jgi:allophanate hydrolase subunit 2